MRAPKRGQRNCHFVPLWFGFYGFAVILGFAVRWEPAPSDILAGLAFLAAIVWLIPRTHLGVISSLRNEFFRGPMLGFAGFVTAYLFSFALSAPETGSLRYCAITLYLIALGVVSAVIAYRATLASKVFNFYLSSAFVHASIVVLVAGATFFPQVKWIASNMAFPSPFRPMGLFKDPNVGASYLVPAALLLGTITIAHSSRKTRWLLYCFILLGMLEQSSRGAFVSFAVGYIVLLMLLKDVPLSNPTLTPGGLF